MRHYLLVVERYTNGGISQTEWELGKPDDWEIDGGVLCLKTRDGDRYFFSPSFWCYCHPKSVKEESDAL